MEIKVVNAGKCMICGKPIKIVVHRGYGKLPNICFCRECEPELKHDRKRLKSKEGAEMSEKPILFNTAMVRAILEGRKTVTRRILKLPSYIEQSENNPDLYTLYAEGDAYPNQYMENIIGYIRPPYKVGDVLYIRETWAKITGASSEGGYAYKYKASDEGEYWSRANGFKWKPSIHMPKEAARIWLKVTNVRTERLNNMSCTDVLNEGIKPAYNPLFDFIELWESTINKQNLNKYGWDANPWVWVIEFERIEK